MPASIEDIERAYKRAHGSKKINKSTKKWKRFYSAYRYNEKYTGGAEKLKKSISKSKEEKLKNPFTRKTNKTKSLSRTYVWRNTRFAQTGTYSDENEAYKVARRWKKEHGTKYRIVPTVENGKKKFFIYTNV